MPLNSLELIPVGTLEHQQVTASLPNRPANKSRPEEGAGVEVSDLKEG